MLVEKVEAVRGEINHETLCQTYLWSLDHHRDTETRPPDFDTKWEPSFCPRRTGMFSLGCFTAPSQEISMSQECCLSLCADPLGLHQPLVFTFGVQWSVIYVMEYNI